MTGGAGATADQRMALAREWDDLLDEIRKIPDFEDFLRPADLPTLLTAAVDGPVVVLNVSRWRSDALVVTTEEVLAIPLPALTLDEAHDRLSLHLSAMTQWESAVTAREQADLALQEDSDYAAVARAVSARRDYGKAARSCEEQLVETCRWLWSVAVEPVVSALQLAALPDPPRVWWCPTGPLTLLPIHAAGDGETWLADYAISSYTPTVRALVDARRNRDTTYEADSFLVATALPGASQTTRLLRDLTSLDTPEEDTVEGVRRTLPSHRFVHFDCHADQDLQDPALGGLRLTDGVLRVFDLATLPLDGEYAALAACKSAVGGTNLLDESITLAAALHYTGFRHVIGSLWILSDHGAVALFDQIYRHLCQDERFNPEGSARALAQATKKMRLSGEGIRTWAALVHIGP